MSVGGFGWSGGYSPGRHGRFWGDLGDKAYAGEMMACPLLSPLGLGGIGIAPVDEPTSECPLVCDILLFQKSSVKCQSGEKRDRKYYMICFKQDLASICVRQVVWTSEGSVYL